MGSPCWLIWGAGRGCLWLLARFDTESAVGLDVGAASEIGLAAGGAAGEGAAEVGGLWAADCVADDGRSWKDCVTAAALLATAA